MCRLLVILNLFVHVSVPDHFPFSLLLSFIPKTAHCKRTGLIIGNKHRIKIRYIHVMGNSQIVKENNTLQGFRYVESYYNCLSP